MKILEVTQPIEEGRNDPHIFKAVFTAGGPGSGKSFMANKLLAGSGLKAVNSDDIFEYLMKKNKLDLDADTIATEPAQALRQRAKTLTNKKADLYIDGRLGLIIDGTGKDLNKIKNSAAALKELGYDTAMLFVNTSLDIAQDRNQKRARSVPAEMVDKMWNAVQVNLMKFQNIFGANNFWIVDNSGEKGSTDLTATNKHVNRFLSTPVTNGTARGWLDQTGKK